jgi:hypothetical protein
MRRYDTGDARSVSRTRRHCDLVVHLGRVAARLLPGNDAGLFAVTAILQWSLLRREGGRIWRSYLFVAIYMGLLTFSMVGYDLLIGDRLPPQVMLRRGTFVYFFLFLALVALTYSPRLVLWAGLIGAISWSTGVALIIAQPGTLTPLEFPLALT